jgi:hypothetical protein
VARALLRAAPTLMSALAFGLKHATPPPMRIAAALVLALVCPCFAQFKSTVPLVFAPTTVTDSKGRYVDGIAPEDLILYDNNVPQPIHVDWTPLPISVVVAVETAANSVAVIDKLGRAGILLTQLLAADTGETALLSFGDESRSIGNSPPRPI